MSAISRPPMLGTIERRVLSAGFALLVALLAYVFHNFDDRLTKQGEAMVEMAKQQAVSNDRLATITLQLSGVPSLTQRVAEQGIKIDRNTADIHELQEKANARTPP